MVFAADPFRRCVFHGFDMSACAHLCVVVVSFVTCQQTSAHDFFRL
jgi:hypothetical protein